MTDRDLRILEIGLELYKRDEPLNGKCEDLIERLIQVVRDDISGKRRKAKSRTRTQSQPLVDLDVSVL